MYMICEYKKERKNKGIKNMMIYGCIY
jgi:hypothetical protein